MRLRLAQLAPLAAVLDLDLSRTGVRHARLGGAEACLAELAERGGRRVVARAIVLRLAADLAERTRTGFGLEAAARPLLAHAPPEWN
jgi:hypothetical protein